MYVSTAPNSQNKHLYVSTAPNSQNKAAGITFSDFMLYTARVIN